MATAKNDGAERKSVLAALIHTPPTLLFSRSRIGRVGPLQHDDHVVVARGAHPLRVEHRAEQEQFGAGETLAHLDIVLAHFGHQDRLALGRRRRRAQQRRKEDEEGGPAPHNGITV